MLRPVRAVGEGWASERVIVAFRNPKRSNGSGGKGNRATVPDVVMATR